METVKFKSCPFCGNSDIEYVDSIFRCKKCDSAWNNFYTFNEYLVLSRNGEKNTIFPEDGTKFYIIAIFDRIKMTVLEKVFDSNVSDSIYTFSNALCFNTKEEAVEKAIKIAMETNGQLMYSEV